MGRDMSGGEFTPPEQAEFERIKKLVLKVVPDAEQVISYGMPTFKYNGKVILHVGAFTHHMSIFPAGKTDLFIDELKEYKTSKGTIQFTLDKPLPDALITKIATVRKEMIEKGE